MFDFRKDGFDDTFFRDEMFCWENRDSFEILDELVCEVFDTSDAVESIAEELESDDRFTR